MAAGQRRALVIGNNDYRSLSRLSNAVNDAHGVSGAIRHLDFHVSYHTNLEHDELRDVAEDFVHSIRQGDTVFFTLLAMVFKSVIQTIWLELMHPK
jgi:uncharacterized caspase-like protein